MARNIKIFLFHRISPERDPFWDPIDPAHFEYIITLMKRKYEVVSLHAAVTGNLPETKRYAVITFDDGYKDFQEYALPILNKYKLPASMFIITDCADTGLPPWTYLLDYYFRKTAKRHLKIAVAPFKGNYLWKYNCERVAFGKWLKPELKRLPATTVKQVLDSVATQFDDVDFPVGLMLNWNEIRELKYAGIEIGSHTVSHPLLANLTDRKEIEYEVKESRNRIKEKLGEFPVCLSYPVGSYDNTVKEATKQAGYKYALAVKEQSYDPNKHDLFEVPRVSLFNENKLKTRLRMRGTIQRIKSLLQ